MSFFGGFLAVFKEMGKEDFSIRSGKSLLSPGMILRVNSLDGWRGCRWVQDGG